MGKPLSDTKIKGMWDLYEIGNNPSMISKCTGICLATVTKYCKKDDWIKRKTKILKKAQTHNNNLEAKRIAKQLRTATRMEKLGNNYFYTGKGKLRKGIKRKMNPRDALTAMKEGVLLQRTILGQDDGVDSDIREITIVYVDSSNKELPRPRKRVESEVKK